MPDKRVPPDAAPHPAGEQVAAFLDGGLRGAERDALVEHLAGCADCRREVVELRRVLSPTPSWRPRWGAVATGLAAVLAFAMVPRLFTARGGRPVPNATRAAPGARAVDAAAPIETVAPRDGDGIPRLAPTLVWRAAGADASYLVTVQDTAGTVVWSDTRADTSATLPATVTLAPGHRYFWSVDARLADGQATKTGVHAFTAR